MQLLNNINEKYLLAIDIETVRIEENFEDLSDGYKSAWEYKNKQDGQIPDLGELSDKWERMSALYAEFSKVCAVSIAFLDKTGSSLICREFFGDDEVKILKDVKNLLDKIYLTDSNYRLIGHAAKYFDYPFLSKRYIINSLKIPSILDTAHLKPWESKNLCTNMDIWKMGGTGPGSSLQALCNCLGLEVSKTDLVGDEVGKAYYEGEFEKIGRYCSQDTIAVFNIFLRIKGLPVFNFEDVKYVSDINEKITVFHKIKALNSFDEEIQKELRENIENVDEVSKKVLAKAIEAAYIRDDFINGSQDTKKEKEEKMEQINKFIKTL